MEHLIKFERGRDCINFECAFGSERCYPTSGGSHGKSGMNIFFISFGKAGAVRFQLYTGWIPVAKENPLIDIRSCTQARYLAYHSKRPIAGSSMSKDCDVLGCRCYSNGSVSGASDAFRTLVNGGDEELWNFLDAYYNFVFNKGEYPKVFDYPFPKRGEQI